MAKNKLSSETIKQIVAFFVNRGNWAYSYFELSKILKTNRSEWGLTGSLGFRPFLEFLLFEKILQKVSFNFPGLKATKYIYGKPSVYELISALNKNGYFSHETAIFLHGLHYSQPKMIYFNIEQSPKYPGNNVLRQEAIDRAFLSKQRVSANTTTVRGEKVSIINGKSTNNLGVVKLKSDFGYDILATNLERTLIDISVRPTYAGGPKNVLVAYKNALVKVNVDRLLEYLRKIDYVYPYHQVIGFYLEKSGCEKERAQSFFDGFNREFDFYLTHDMKKTKFSKKWRLHYPSNL